MNLREAAQAVLDRWDSPQWEWSQHGPTADLMHDLRRALSADAQVSGASAPVGQPAGEQTGPVAEAPTRVTSGYFRVVDPSAPAGLEWE